MKFPEGVMLFGDIRFRGECPVEDLELMSFFNRLRRLYPKTYGAVAIHPRNEGLVRGAQFSAMAKLRAQGMVKGAADIVIPAKVSFVCEMKRMDHTKSTWQTGQQEYLKTCVELGAFTCIALGAIAALEAFEKWRLENES